MVGHGVVEAVGEVRGQGRCGGSWMLGVGLIPVEDVGGSDRGGRRFGGLLMRWLGVEITIHYLCGKS